MQMKDPVRYFSNLILHSSRLDLIPFCQMDDDLRMHEIFTHAAVKKHLWDDRILSMQESKEIFIKNKQYFEENGWGLWKATLVSNNDWVGFAGLWPFFEEKNPQLIYGLLPPFWHRGFATEAARKVIGYAFTVLHFEYLIASFDTDNILSGKVTERLGMHFTETKVINKKSTEFYRIDKKDFNAIK
ncbi:MAG TPA: GNAT family N-acetyltransferase [Saprospiraceae bacterium]|nr:GNAT family N-acetyltransferase [Saprospiraceae bacterium]